MQDQEQTITARKKDEEDESFWDMFPVNKNAARLVSGFIIGAIVLWVLYNFVRYGITIGVTVQ